MREGGKTDTGTTEQPCIPLLDRHLPDRHLDQVLPQRSSVSEREEEVWWNGSLVQGYDSRLGARESNSWRSPGFHTFLYFNWGQFSPRRKTLVGLKGHWFLPCPGSLEAAMRSPTRYKEQTTPRAGPSPDSSGEQEFVCFSSLCLQQGTF